MVKRAYSPKEIAMKTYKTLPWSGRWASLHSDFATRRV